MDILIYGDIPDGAGLSSSASLEVLIGVMLKDIYGFDVSMTDIALWKWCRKIINEKEGNAESCYFLLF